MLRDPRARERGSNEGGGGAFGGAISRGLRRRRSRRRRARLLRHSRRRRLLGRLSRRRLLLSHRTQRGGESFERLGGVRRARSNLLQQNPAQARVRHDRARRRHLAFRRARGCAGVRRGVPGALHRAFTHAQRVLELAQQTGGGALRVAEGFVPGGGVQRRAKRFARATRRQSRGTLVRRRPPGRRRDVFGVAVRVGGEETRVDVPVPVVVVALGRTGPRPRRRRRQHLIRTRHGAASAHVFDGRREGRVKIVRFRRVRRDGTLRRCPSSARGRESTAVKRRRRRREGIRRRARPDARAEDALVREEHPRGWCLKMRRGGEGAWRGGEGAWRGERRRFRRSRTGDAGPGPSRRRRDVRLRRDVRPRPRPRPRPVAGPLQLVQQRAVHAPVG